MSTQLLVTNPPLIGAVPRRVSWFGSTSCSVLLVCYFECAALCLIAPFNRETVEWIFAVWARQSLFIS